MQGLNEYRSMLLDGKLRPGQRIRIYPTRKGDTFGPYYEVEVVDADTLKPTASYSILNPKAKRSLPSRRWEIV